MKSKSCATEYARSCGCSRASASAASCRKSGASRSRRASGCPVGSDAERDDEIADLVVGRLDADTATVLLQHVDARPSVRRIHHEVHGPVRVEHVAQCPERRVRVREMMQNARAHDLIERQLQLADTIDRELMDREIAEVVPALQTFRVPDTRRTEVDPDDPRRGTARGVLRRLRCAAAGHEDRALFRVRLLRPEQVKVRAASVLVLPPSSIVVEIVGRPRIRIPFVEVLDCCRHVRPAADPGCRPSSACAATRPPLATFRWCSPP